MMIRPSPYRIACVRSFWTVAVFAFLIGSCLLGRTAPSVSAQTPSDGFLTENAPPVLAYYYIWFDPQSWDRAKTDYPVLGRYSSDDAGIMRQHVKWAKAAGLDGFIVSWKNTDRLSRRLAQLVEVARDEDFKLVLIYQGLDFARDPLSIDQIAADLDYFTETYRNDEVFNLFGRPAVIWSGTWEFSREEIDAVTGPRRDQLLILASEKQVDNYLKLADIVDGNAYYWSSVNPETQPDYGEKLQRMADAVHTYGGLWIAPASPGFDARLIGGTRVVDRNDGETLSIQLSTALESSPDAVGIISWNEFSENSHIEPSCDHGDRYLQVLAKTLGGNLSGDVGPCAEATPVSASNSLADSGGSTSGENSETAFDFDSSSPGGIEGFGVFRAMMLGMLMVLVGGSMAVVGWRSRTHGSYGLVGGGKKL